MTTPSKMDPPRPRCFDSDDEFIGWCNAARKVNVCSSPCDDCSDTYKARVGDRCDEFVVREIFVIGKQVPRK